MYLGINACKHVCMYVCMSVCVDLSVEMNACVFNEKWSSYRT